MRKEGRYKTLEILLYISFMGLSDRFHRSPYIESYNLAHGFTMHLAVLSKIESFKAVWFIINIYHVALKS